MLSTTFRKLDITTVISVRGKQIENYDCLVLGFGEIYPICTAQGKPGNAW